MGDEKDLIRIPERPEGLVGFGHIDEARKGNPMLGLVCHGEYFE